MTRIARFCLAALWHSENPRHAIKTASYAAMHLGVAMLVAFALTRSWQAALAIGLIEPFVQTFAYALHERAWARLPRTGPDHKAHTHNGCI
jgi:uncharacterized membrane protein